VGKSSPLHPAQRTSMMRAATSLMGHGTKSLRLCPFPSRPFASKQSIESKGIAHAKNVGRSVVI
jgi:hypothetical protein